MASAKKCDRCGKYYDKNELYSRTYNGTKSVVDGMCLTLKNGHTIEHSDLCDDCIHELGLFLSGYELVMKESED